MKRAWIIGLAALAAACGKAPDGVMQGYGEADYLYLASQEAGVVQELFVKEGDAVEAGAPVFRLEPERLQHSAAGAAASQGALGQAVRAAGADAVLAQRNFARGQELFQSGYYPRARLDADRAALDAANARLSQARRELGAAGAQSELAEERLHDLDIAAPTAGRVERIFHRPGEVVAAGAPVISLLAPQNVKVRFFAPEALLSQLAPGARVTISCDGCAAGLTATVSYAASDPQFTPPVIYSLEQRQKLVFLIEARPDNPAAIRPGIPVDVRLAS
jgi:HlyD family secretion protein